MEIDHYHTPLELCMPAEFGLSCPPLVLRSIRKKEEICSILSHLPICGICCVILEYPRINQLFIVNYALPRIEKFLTKEALAMGDHLYRC